MKFKTLNARNMVQLSEMTTHLVGGLHHAEAIEHHLNP